MNASEKQAARPNAVHPGESGARVQLVRSSEGGAEARPRYSGGWRAGKPEEDPEKLKRWGLVTARPSEFLIHMRGGRVRGVSGQGASCFKLPGDAVAIVPTSVQRLQFTTDQVTSEKVGVQVTGLAVYRIVEPLVAFRMLNFSFPERASEKLQELLHEMFVGAARRLVANLTVEQCLTRRKEGIASELMRELAPVLSGRGRVEDTTDSGWGVVLDTIEIQDVRVLSATVFEHMQARYRREQERQAREAELAKELFVRREEADSERQVALTRLAASEEVRRKKQAAEEASQLEKLASEARVAEARLAQQRAHEQAQAEAEREAQLRRLHAEAELRQRQQAAEEASRLEQLAAERRLGEAKLAQERAHAAALADAGLERLRHEQDASAARHEGEMALLLQEAERVRAQVQLAEARQALAQAEASIAELEVRRQHAQQELELSRARALREIENTLSPERIQLMLAQQLPQLAAAFQQRMGEVHITAVDGANPFGYIAAAMEGVMGLARSAGLKVPGPAGQPAQ